MAAQGESIEISKDSIKISYIRYLADSAPGFILIGALVWSAYSGSPEMGGLACFLRSPDVPTEVRAFFLLIVFLLATPVGLLVNALGWFILGKIQSRGATFWFRAAVSDDEGRDLAQLLMASTNESSRLDLLTAAFGLDESNFYKRTRLLANALDVHCPSAVSGLSHVRGLMFFVRSFTLLCALATLASVFRPIFVPWPAWLGAAFGLGLLLSWLQYYECLEVALACFTLVAKRDPSQLFDTAAAESKTDPYCLSLLLKSLSSPTVPET